MRKAELSILAAAVTLTASACSTERDDNASGANVAETEVITETETGTTADAGAAGATTNWPAGSRIVVEEGVTYRVEPGGTRVRLGPDDSRIVVENGTRFRVDPDGTRFRIDEQGAVVSTTDEGVTTDVRVGDDPSVEVNTNP